VKIEKLKKESKKSAPPSTKNYQKYSDEIDYMIFKTSSKVHFKRIALE
jgi:hypothetical protein